MLIGTFSELRILWLWITNELFRDNYQEPMSYLFCFLKKSRAGNLLKYHHCLPICRNMCSQFLKHICGNYSWIISDYMCVRTCVCMRVCMCVCFLIPEMMSLSFFVCVPYLNRIWLKTICKWQQCRRNTRAWIHPHYHLVSESKLFSNVLSSWHTLWLIFLFLPHW